MGTLDSRALKLEKRLVREAEDDDDEDDTATNDAM